MVAADRNASIAPVTLSDGVVELRPWRGGDAAALHEAARESIATVGPWLPWLTLNYALADSEDWVSDSARHWRQGTEFRFGVFEPGPGGRCLGGAGLNHLNAVHGIGNLGYWVRSTCTGRGIGSRAARLVARFGLTTAGLGRVEILTACDNLASQGVAARIGARFEGVLRDRLQVHGQRIPARLYALVRDDLPRLTDP
jgi:RimJ/RimL family protein N-acetyltransferase